MERRFTAAGLLTFGGMITVGAIGVDVSQSVGAQTFALLFCLLLEASVAGLFFKGRFEILRQLPRYGSVDQEFQYRVTIRNRSQRQYGDLVLWEDFVDPRPTLKEFASRFRSKRRKGQRPSSPPWISYRQTKGGHTRNISLKAGGQCETQITITPLRRGPLRFTGSVLGRPDPLGLFRGWIKIPQPESILVLPKRYAVPALTLPGMDRHQPGGVEFASSIGASDQFISLRDYRPGDPLRHIHWRSWAHASRPIVKEFQDEFFVRHALVLDTAANDDQAEAFEEAVSVAASFACTVTTQESLLDLLFVGEKSFCLTTGRGVGHTEQALEVLASVQPSPQQSFTLLQDLVLHHAHQTCACICVLLQWDEPRKSLVRRLRSMGLPVWALIIANPSDAKHFANTPSTPTTEHCHVLQVGRIEQDLQLLNAVAP